MSKNKKLVIFIGGLRGCGKTTILNYFKNKKIFKTLEFIDLIRKIYKPGISWREIENQIGLNIRNLVKKYNKVMIALHYAVPHESLIDDIKNNVVRDYSAKYSPSLTSNMLKSMNDDDINLIFFYISVNLALLRKRLMEELKIDPSRVSNNYLKNLTKLMSEDRAKFKEIVSKYQTLNTNTKYFIISNNYSIRNTITIIKNKINT